MTKPASKTKRWIVPVCIAISLLWSTTRTAHAILFTPPAKPGKFTLGATEIWVHRDAEWIGTNLSSEDKYNLGAIWAKYGVHRRVTLFVEFAILNGDPHNEGTSYRHINLGAGINTLLVEREDFFLSILFNYFENFQHDNQKSNCHAMSRHWAGLLQIGKTFPIEPQHELTAWWAPAYIRNEQIFDGGDCLTARNKSVNNFGFAAGVNFLFWDHLELFGHLVWANYFQPRLGIGYQF